MRRRSAQTPEMIVQAAEALIRREGGARLTIDAVAAEAGLSKGGVMHHFASRDALITAMVQHQFGRMDAEMREIEAALPPSRMAPLVAMIRHARTHYGGASEFPKALLLASAENPEALEEYRNTIADTLAKIDGAGTPAIPSVLFFAALGLLLSKSLGFHDYGQAEAGALLDALESMAGRAAEG